MSRSNCKRPRDLRKSLKTFQRMPQFERLRLARASCSARLQSQTPRFSRLCQHYSSAYTLRPAISHTKASITPVVAKRLPPFTGTFAEAAFGETDSALALCASSLERVIPTQQQPRLGSLLHLIFGAELDRAMPTKASAAKAKGTAARATKRTKLPNGTPQTKTPQSTRQTPALKSPTAQPMQPAELSEKDRMRLREWLEVTDRPFQVRTVPLSRKRKRQNVNQLQTQDDLFEERLAVQYEVKPRDKWESLRRYKKFTGKATPLGLRCGRLLTGDSWAREHRNR